MVYCTHVTAVKAECIVLWQELMLYIRGQDTASIKRFLQDSEALLLEWHHDSKGLHMLDSVSQLTAAYKQTASSLEHSHTLPRKEGKTTIWITVYYPTDATSTLDPFASTLALHFGHYALGGHVRLLKACCWECRKQTTKLCRRCKRAVYCSASCIRQAWPEHRAVCRKPTLHPNVHLHGKDVGKNKSN